MKKMNKISHHVALAVLLAAPSSHAAIGIETGAGFDPNGELFLTVYDSANGISYTRDLGIFASQFNMNVAQFSFTPDALFTSTFAGSDPNDMRYAVVGLADRNFDFFPEVWTTSNDANINFPTDASLTLGAIVDGVGDFARAVDQSVPTTDIFENVSTVINDPSSDGYYTNPATFGESLASVVLFNIAAPIGTPLAFHSMSQDFIDNEGRVINFDRAWTLNLDGSLTYAPPVETDTDEDGVVDLADNCVETSNPMQTDSDDDGFGNACDTDLNNDCITNVVDLGLLRSVFFSDFSPADFNADGNVNFFDLGIMRVTFLRAPGPSGSASCE